MLRFSAGSECMMDQDLRPAGFSGNHAELSNRFWSQSDIPTLRDHGSGQRLPFIPIINGSAEELQMQHQSCAQIPTILRLRPFSFANTLRGLHKFHADFGWSVEASVGDDDAPRTKRTPSDRVFALMFLPVRSSRIKIDTYDDINIGEEIIFGKIVQHAIDI